MYELMTIGDIARSLSVARTRPVIEAVLTTVRLRNTRWAKKGGCDD